MDPKVSQKIILENNLIPADISKEILWRISNNAKIDSRVLPRNISLEQIDHLRELYEEIANELGVSAQKGPRNEIFYRIIRDKYPKFSWQVHGKSVVFNHVRIGKLEPSLLSLLIQEIRPMNQVSLTLRYDYEFNISDDKLTLLDEIFSTLNVIYPDTKTMIAIIEWLQAGLRGEKLNIFSLACPDYSTEPTNNPKCPYRHTFNSVGSGIGLIARRVLDALPILTDALKKMGIEVSSTLAMADYEILSKNNLQRLNLSQIEFYNRIESSRIEFKKESACQNAIMLTELCGGYEEWGNQYNYFRNQFLVGNFGLSQITEQDLIAMVKSRRQLYESWHGIRETLEEYIPILLDQAAEYAAIGSMIHKHFSNCLILGGDHSVFSPFYSVDQFIPALYLKRYYC